jgi:hypothetical protein
VTRYEEEAWRALQALFDDERRSVLADRVNEILDLLDAGGADRRARAGRTQSPPYWMVSVHGSGEDWLILWEFNAEGEVNVAYAGPGSR